MPDAAMMLSLVDSARFECRASSSLSKFRAKVKELPRPADVADLWAAAGCANREAAGGKGSQGDTVTAPSHL